MGLTRALLRAAARRPHVLVAALPGGTAVRLAVEEGLRLRGWPAASGPADADVLLVAGTPDPRMAEVLERIWAAMPPPRVRAEVVRPGDVVAALDGARRTLAAYVERRDEAVGEEEPPMADRGEDRDGLKLDDLHVPLGPVLPAWPSGLIVHVTMQGDVITEARVEAVRTESGSFWAEPWRRAVDGETVTTAEAARRGMAAQLDGLGRFLTVAGWDEAAVTACRLRDETLAGGEPAWLRRFCRRVTRSATLRWLTVGLGEDGTGDVTTRYRTWCAAIPRLADLLDDRSRLDPAVLGPPREPAARTLAALPRLLTGTELAGARLIVASLAPDLDELPVRAEVPHGG